MEQKMDWLVRRFNANECEYLINSTHEKKGTIVAPTGAGKSGIMYEDVFKHIEDSTVNEKWVFHFATPILKLGVQTINDLIFPLTTIFKDKCDNGEFMFFINSSADGKSYDIEDLNADTNRFENFHYFLNGSNAKYAIVVSCFDSLYKFAEKINEINAKARVVTYIDEAHLIISEARDDKSFEKTSIEGKQRWNCLEELCKGEFLYALTATPDKYVTQIINKSANKKDADIDSLLINIEPRDLIAKNIILPVTTLVCKVSNSTEEMKITPSHCEYFMGIVKDNNSNIAHKILVTCSDTDHLRFLRDELSKKFKVFSTCARDGGNTNNEGDDEFVGIDEVDFINEVDSYDGDCFVLHIKQLRQGIDIKSLTDCIIYNSTRVNDGVKRTLIQTIGRCLRPAINERGRGIDLRTKKEGMVYLLVGEKDEEAVERQMENFIIDYYGTKGVKCFTNDLSHNYGQTGKNKGSFSFGDGKFGDDYWRNYFDILADELMVNIRDYIKRNIKPKYDAFVRLSGGKPNPKLIPSHMAQILREFAYYDGEHKTSELLTETQLMKAISDLFEEYEIKAYA